MSTYCHETIRALPAPSAQATTWKSATGRAFRRLITDAEHLVAVWRMRQVQRRDLRRLPDHLLRDIGFNANEARRESDKPFWRA